MAKADIAYWNYGHFILCSVSYSTYLRMFPRFQVRDCASELVVWGSLKIQMCLHCTIGSEISANAMHEYIPLRLHKDVASP